MFMAHPPFVFSCSTPRPTAGLSLLFPTPCHLRCKRASESSTTRLFEEFDRPCSEISRLERRGRFRKGCRRKSVTHLRWHELSTTPGQFCSSLTTTLLLWKGNRCKAQGSKRARLTETQASATLECRARRRRRWPQCGGPVARSAAAVSAQQRLPCRLLQPSPGSHRAKAREATVTSSSALRPPPGSGHPTR